jgi:hypothetical protein
MCAVVGNRYLDIFDGKTDFTLGATQYIPRDEVPRRPVFHSAVEDFRMFFFFNFCLLFVVFFFFLLLLVAKNSFFSLHLLHVCVLCRRPRRTTSTPFPATCSPPSSWRQPRASHPRPPQRRVVQVQVQVQVVAAVRCCTRLERY